MNRNHYTGWLLSMLILTVPVISHADQTLWQDVSLSTKSADITDSAFKHRQLQLDETQLSTLIKQLKRQDPAAEIALSLPLPDGDFVDVRLVPITLLTPEAQQRQPDTYTWRIASDDPAVTSGRAELTALGFHAMLLTSDRDRIYIEPEQRTTIAQARNYHSHSRRENTRLNNQRRFNCGQLIDTKDFNWQLKTETTAQRAGEELLTYDLAMAATGEYTQQFGGSKAAAKAAIVTTINRINEIFEQELSLSLRLLDNSDIIYTNPLNDPYTNGVSTLLLLENQANLDNVIKSQNYDIGHVLGATSGGDGLAVKGAACNNNIKAQGSTSALGQLTSDAFMVDFVAHELGHQLGATHTFNSNSIGSCGGGNRTATAAYEPGSGTTIMSYAGICGSNDIRKNVDPQFHPASIQQIRDFTHNGNAASCAERTSLNNQLPVANAGDDYTIPARTPFILNGSASDSNGDKLMYSWDQMDVGTASALGVDTANNALIRTSTLSASPLRNVPDISDLLTLNQNTSHGESLPRSDRQLNFRLTVRDGKGAVSFDDTRLTVRDTGARFEVLTPGGNVAAGSQRVTWKVAGTDQSPISCSHVDIAYTNNQGRTFTDLLSNTPNDGSATVQLNTTAQHIRVKCRDNIFFALSGTTPHIATFNGDTSQDTDSSATDNDDGDGGGGPLPIGLLISLTLMLFFSKVTAETRRNFS